MKRLLGFCLLSSLALLLSSAPASAVVAMYIEGVDQGHIQGDLLLDGEVGNIDVSSFSSSIYVPYDQASGQPSGRRQYSPITVTKLYDRSTVNLLQAITVNEPLRFVRLHFYTYGGQTPQLYYTVELQDARIVSYDQNGDDSNPPVETWGFTFKSVLWTDEIRHVTTKDNWTDVVAAVLPPGPSENLTLLPPLPNPADSESVIRFDLPLSSHATLDVFDLKGRRVARLFDRTTDHARTVVRWDGRDSSGSQVANGLYFVRLRSPKGEVTQRVTFMR